MDTFTIGVLIGLAIGVPTIFRFMYGKARSYGSNDAGACVFLFVFLLVGAALLFGVDALFELLP